MPRIIGIHISLILFFFLLTGCSTSIVQLDNDRIKENIKDVVKDYSSKNWEQRRKSVINISRYSESVYAKNVIIFLLLATEDTHPLVRIEAASALGKIRAVTAMSRLQEMAENDPGLNVRWHAVRALSTYADKENLQIFIKGIDNRDWLIREASTKGLLKINDPVILKNNMIYIKKSLTDSSLSVRIAALMNLQIKNEELYLIISEIVRNKKSGLSVKKAALTAIKGYKFDDKTRKIITSLLIHWDGEMRILALRALKEEQIVKKF